MLRDNYAATGRRGENHGGSDSRNGLCSPCFYSRHFPPSGENRKKRARRQQLFGNPQSPRLQQFLKGSLKASLRWLTLPEYFHGEFASQLPLKCKSCSPLKS
ncbi:hypothetical protein ACLB1T_01855 [Escherichia coli]